MRTSGSGPGVIVMIVGLLLGQTVLAADKAPSGTVEIDEVQVAFLVSGNLGGGTLHFKGKSYRFQIGGLGVGGIGASSIKATGKVYDLNDVADFAGAYGQARTGAVVGDMGTGGQLWLQNPDGVVMSLTSKREGAMLSLGADAIVVKMEN